MKKRRCRRHRMHRRAKVVCESRAASARQTVPRRQFHSGLRTRRPFYPRAPAQPPPQARSAPTQSRSHRILRAPPRQKLTTNAAPHGPRTFERGADTLLVSCRRLSRVPHPLNQVGQRPKRSSDGFSSAIASARVEQAPRWVSDDSQSTLARQRRRITQARNEAPPRDAIPPWNLARAPRLQKENPSS